MPLPKPITYEDIRHAKFRVRNIRLNVVYELRLCRGQPHIITHHTSGFGSFAVRLSPSIFSNRQNILSPRQPIISPTTSSRLTMSKAIVLPTAETKTTQTVTILVQAEDTIVPRWAAVTIVHELFMRTRPVIPARLNHAPRDTRPG